MITFKIEYKIHNHYFTKKVSDNVDKDCPKLSKFVERYWDGDIDNVKITNLETGQVIDYDKEESLRRVNER